MYVNVVGHEGLGLSRCVTETVCLCSVKILLKRPFVHFSFQLHSRLVFDVANSVGCLEGNYLINLLIIMGLIENLHLLLPFVNDIIPALILFREHRP